MGEGCEDCLKCERVTICMLRAGVFERSTGVEK